MSHASRWRKPLHLGISVLPDRRAILCYIGSTKGSRIWGGRSGEGRGEHLAGHAVPAWRHLGRIGYELCPVLRGSRAGGAVPAQPKTPATIPHSHRRGNEFRHRAAMPCNAALTGSSSTAPWPPATTSWPSAYEATDACIASINEWLLPHEWPDPAWRSSASVVTAAPVSSRGLTISRGAASRPGASRVGGDRG